MNAITSLLVKLGLPKIARHLVAVLGGVLAAHGSSADANNPVELVAGLSVIGLAAVWSFVKRMGDEHPDGWVNKITDAWDHGDWSDLRAALSPVLMNLVGSVAVKAVQGVAGAMAIQGGEVTTEGLIVSAATLLASKVRTPDKPKAAALPAPRK